jgi:hypothetical protein
MLSKLREGPGDHDQTRVDLDDDGDHGSFVAERFECKVTSSMMQVEICSSDISLFFLTFASCVCFRAFCIFSPICCHLRSF